VLCAVEGSGCMARWQCRELQKCSCR
jgi:hypothetical protein